MKIVEIEWLDSVSGSPWESKEEAERDATRETMLHRTVGYLLQENDDFVLVAQSKSESDEVVGATMQIPRLAIMRVKQLYHL